MTKHTEYVKELEGMVKVLNEKLNKKRPTANVGHATSAGGPFAVMRMPVKGYVIAGGKGNASYHDTDDDMRESFVALCAVEGGTDEDDVFTAGLLKCITGQGWAVWAKAQPSGQPVTDKALAMSVLRLSNAYLCTYGEGLIVCRDLDQVRMMVDEYVAFRYPPKKVKTGIGPLTQEELAQMLADVKQAVEPPEVPAQDRQS